MTVDDLDLYVYDFEVFAHDWLCVFYHVLDGKELWFWNEQSDELIEFVSSNNSSGYVSYNGSHYDRWIMTAIFAGLTPEEVKEVNDFIISDTDLPWNHPYLQGKYLRFNDIDLMKDVQIGTSLKSIEAHKGWDIRESDVDFRINRALTEDERERTLTYCRADVKATYELFKVRRDYLNTKLSLAERADLKVFEALRLTNAKLTAEVLRAEKTEDFKDERDYKVPSNLLIDNIPIEVQEFFAQLKSDISDEDLWSQKLDITVGDCPVTIGFGGIHGAIPKYKGVSGNGRSIINVDVSSYYPSLMIYNGYISRSIPSASVFENIYHERLQAKHAGDKDTANALKLIVNTTYGAMLNQYNELYDPLMARSVCISGQLYLLELAVSMVKQLYTVKIVQLNTDGLMVSIDDSELEAFSGICNEWTTRTHFELEQDNIELIRQKDVNNYVMRTTDGHTKAKGSYLVRGESVVGAYSINTNATIVVKALKEYLLNDTPIKDTINNSTDSSEFALVAKAGTKYSKAFHLVNGEEVPIQKCNRVFATSDTNLGKLYKIKAVNGQVAKIESMPEHCLIHNDGYCKIEQIDKEFYIKLAQKRAQDFKAEVIDMAGKTEPKNVYQKLALARKMFLDKAPKKSGINEHLEYSYFELSDIVPVQNEIFNQLGLLEVFSQKVVSERIVEGAHCLDKVAESTVINADNPSETITFSVDWIKAEQITSSTGKKVTTALQAEGSSITYLRRYLKMMMLDIVEVDETEATTGETPVKTTQTETKSKGKEKSPRAQTRKQAEKKLTDSSDSAESVQVDAIKRALKVLKTEFEDSDERKELTERIKTETKSLKEITKEQASEFLKELGELRNKLKES